MGRRLWIWEGRSGSPRSRPQWWSRPRAVRPVAGSAVASSGIHKIQHVIVIMQENRSFDEYFGTFPGADGIPMAHGIPTVVCARPGQGWLCPAVCSITRTSTWWAARFVAARADIDHGKMDGFIAASEPTEPTKCADLTDPDCVGDQGCRRHVMALPHRKRHPELLEIRTELRVAGPHVRAHRVVEPARASLSRSRSGRRTVPTHTAASCSANMRTRPAEGDAEDLPKSQEADDEAPIFAWTDLTYLLHKHHVSWGYYVVAGTEPDCANSDALDCAPVKQNADTRASGIRCHTSTPCATTTSSETSNRSTNFYKAAHERHPARSLLGRSILPRERTLARSRSAPAWPTSPVSSTQS